MFEKNSDLMEIVVLGCSICNTLFAEREIVFICVTQLLFEMTYHPVSK